MAGELKLPSTKQETSSAPSNSYNQREMTGKIADHIGTGKNAKDSFIWMTITWSFYIATGLSVLMFVRGFFAPTATDNILSEIVDVWGIFIPIITLALGYAFGKGE